jgi:hypothetical protein
MLAVGIRATALTALRRAHMGNLAARWERLMDVPIYVALGDFGSAICSPLEPMGNRGEQRLCVHFLRGYGFRLP